MVSEAEMTSVSNRSFEKSACHKDFNRGTVFVVFSLQFLKETKAEKPVTSFQRETRPAGHDFVAFEL